MIRRSSHRGAHMQYTFIINEYEQDLKKLGRSRGDCKTKTPHRIIGFEELTKCISKLWKIKKKEHDRL